MKEKIERKIKRAQKRVDEMKKAHGNNPGSTHTYFGGWDLGYWEGRLSALQDILDELEGDSE